MRAAVALTGRNVLSALSFVGRAALIVGEALGHLVCGRAGGRRAIAQMSVVGVDSLPIVLVTLLFAGMVLGLHTAREFVRFGAGSYVGGMVALSVARELGPVLTGVVVAARVGSAMAAELGSMTITEQIDALRTLAVSPVQYLVVPRLLACLMMLPVLCMLADLSGALGAYLIAIRAGVSPQEYLQSVRTWLQYVDLFAGMGKTVVFGGIIAIVGCERGLSAGGGAAGVGRVTTSAVVISIVLIYVSNYLLSAIIYRLWQQ